MSLSHVAAQVRELLAAARAEHAAHRCTAAVALAYMVIDVLGSLERAEREGTRWSFVRWVDAYLLPNDDIACTATDLYAGRCGVLHTLTPDADLIKRGEARRIVYAWGSGRVADLRELARRIDRDDIAIHVGTLIEAVETGFERFVSEVEADPTRRAFVERRSAAWFGNLPVDVGAAILDATGGPPPSA
jgi:hypothetical protein